MDNRYDFSCFLFSYGCLMHFPVSVVCEVSHLSGLVIALRPQTPKHIRGGWSHYTDTSEPVDGNSNGRLKIWSLSNSGSYQRPFDHWPTSLPAALTGPTLTFLSQSHCMSDWEKDCDLPVRENLSYSCYYFNKIKGLSMVTVNFQFYLDNWAWIWSFDS
jgi:hypothetical protein